MLKKVLSFLGGVSVLCTFASAATTITPVQPNLKNGCYQISNASELYGFAAIVNGDPEFPYDATACGKLTKDIVVNENVLNSDGTLNVADTAKFAKWKPMERFAGNFDGQKHTISGLFFSDTTSKAFDNFGFFGAIVGSGSFVVTVQNFGLVDSYFGTNNGSVGGIVGRMLEYSKATISNVYSHVSIHAHGSSAASGGLIGTVEQWAEANLKNVYNSGSILNDNYYAAGLIGHVMKNGLANVENAYNVGSVKSRLSSYWRSLVGCRTNRPNCGTTSRCCWIW